MWLLLLDGRKVYREYQPSYGVTGVPEVIEGDAFFAHVIKALGLSYSGNSFIFEVSVVEHGTAKYIHFLYILQHGVSARNVVLGSNGISVYGMNEWGTCGIAGYNNKDNCNTNVKVLAIK